jgi:hypothetical protein
MEAAACGTPMSLRTLHMNSIKQPKSEAPMNSTSVDNCATVRCILDLYAIVPPARWTQTPVKERHVLGHVAQSESTKQGGLGHHGLDGHRVVGRDPVLLIDRGSAAGRELFGLVCQ